MMQLYKFVPFKNLKTSISLPDVFLDMLTYGHPLLILIDSSQSKILIEMTILELVALHRIMILAQS
jgi:hypothetical protein